MDSITELSSKIKLDQVPTRLYRPESELELASLTRCEKIYTKIVETPSEGAADVAADIARQITRTVREKGRCVIGLGAGRAALDVYDELVKLYFADKVTFANVVAFNMSELGLGNVREDSQSTISRLYERLFRKVDIDPNNIHTFDPSATKENVHKLCKIYETTIDEYGGLDVVICQLTKTGGLAFNDPGSSSSSSCRLVLLSNETRQRIAESYQCEIAPDTAVTLGMSNLLSARKFYAVAWGEESIDAVYNCIEGKISDLYPASFLQMHRDVKLTIDLEAATRLTRINFPWKVTSCNWTPQLVRRAIVWLSQHTGKPVLKLTNKDYNDNGLSELVTVFGSAYDVNIKIFNDLQHTITGWPGGKPNADDSSRPERALPYPKRVLVFSPHPDDAVVSMGGTLRRLVQQGHDVHVVFQTSGDITVADEDLERTLMLNSMLSDHYGYPQERRRVVAQSIIDGIKAKKPGDPDNAEMRFMKGRILTCESIMGCMYMGVRRDHIHELALPFYESNPYGRGKVTDADVLLIKKIIENIKPTQIFFADDLSDPYGTHMRATNALLLAIDELKEADFMQECRMWMYRGQWGTWDIDHIEMAVPMSPEEFTYKVNGVLKHQSQIHDAPFRDPGDGQLSWQKTIDRNKDTADLYASLGLATYEAMEAFVQYHPER